MESCPAPSLGSSASFLGLPRGFASRLCPVIRSMLARNGEFPIGWPWWSAIRMSLMASASNCGSSIAACRSASPAPN
jgi:hypothetical protein